MGTININFFLSAARTGNIFRLKFSLDSGIDIHYDNDLALRYAKECGQTEAVIFLLENGANIYALDDDAALRYSSMCGDIQTVNHLREKGTCSQEAKLYATYSSMLYGHDKIVKLLLDDGISPTENNGAILKVLKLCTHEKVIDLFKNYLE